LRLKGALSNTAYVRSEQDPGNEPTPDNNDTSSPMSKQKGQGRTIAKWIQKAVRKQSREERQTSRSQMRRDKTRSGSTGSPHGKSKSSSDSDSKDFTVKSRNRGTKSTTTFSYKDGLCVQDNGKAILNPPYTSDLTLDKCGKKCLQYGEECRGITYFVADVEPFERDGHTVRSHSAGDCILMNSITGAEDCDEEYVGKYHLYGREDWSYAATMEA